MSPRPELIAVRDVAIRHLRHRASIDQMRDAVLKASQSMQADGLTMEQILVILKGAVHLAAKHVASPTTQERATSLRSQVTQWLVSLYLDQDAGEDDPDAG